MPSYIHIYVMALYYGATIPQHVFKLQKKVPIINKTHFRDHCKPIFISNKILSLPCIYILQCLKRNFADFTLRGNIHYHDNRNNHLINTYLCCYTTTQNNFNYMPIKLHNSLPLFAKYLEYDNFKRFIKNMLYDQYFYNLDDYFQYISNLSN